MVLQQKVINKHKKSGHPKMTTLRDATNDTTPPFTYRLTGFVNSFF